MISIFANSSGAGEIRGKQIADKIGAKLNPTEGYEDDVCIYVKSVPPTNFPKRTYIDVMEDSAGLRWAKSHSEVKLIASSSTIYAYLDTYFANEKVFIPQHHCNFDRERRKSKSINVVGIIGNKAAFQHSIDDIRKALASIGMELKTLIKKKFTSREEVVDFYKGIDIQLVWRPGSDKILRNPLKLVNAMSFGVLTVAYPEEDFDMELNGYYSDVKTIREMMLEIMRIRRSTIGYKKCSDMLVEKAEEYHIDTISKLYLKLT